MLEKYQLKRLLPVFITVLVITVLVVLTVIIKAQEETGNADISNIVTGHRLWPKITFGMDMVFLGITAGISLILWLIIGRRYAAYIYGITSLILGIAGMSMFIYTMLDPYPWGVLYWMTEYASLASFIPGILCLRRKYRNPRAATVGIILSVASLVLIPVLCIVAENWVWLNVITITVPMVVSVTMFHQTIWSFICRNKRQVITAMPVLAALMVLLILQPWNPYTDLDRVMKKVQEATQELQSYRIEVSTTEKETISPYEILLEMDYHAPDRYHVKQVIDDYTREYILIGDEQYYTESYIPFYEVNSQVTGYSSILAGQTMKGWTDYLIDIRKLPDKHLDGVRCLHYRGLFDIEKKMRDFYEDELFGGIQSGSEEEMEERIEEMLKVTGTTILDFWIGKDDFLPRQILNVNYKEDDSGEIQTIRMFYRFSGYNAEFPVKAPVDSEGELLSGWETATPEKLIIREDIQVEVDNYDPSDRKVEFDIILTNSGSEILTDADVHIISASRDLDRDLSGKVGFSWDNGQWTGGPYTLEPDKSLKYSCTFRYDATVIEPDMIAEIIRDAYVEVMYFIQNGVQKVEIKRLPVPESVYTLTTELSPELTPLDISVSGEYRIEEAGATYTGNGVPGVINEKDYLFVEVNTAGAGSPASPGILVLNIENKTKPGKVSFISTCDDTRYVRGLAVFGTLLYAHIDDNLWIIDVSDPSSPQEISRIPDFEIRQMITHDGYAFVDEKNSGITVLDMADPLNPQKAGRLRIQSAGSIRMEIHNGYLYVETNTSLNVIDISTPTEPEIISEYTFRGPLDEDTPDIVYPYHIMDMKFKDNYGYFGLSAESRLAVSVLDISEPDDPEEVAFMHLKDRRYDGPVFIFGDSLYIFTTKSHDFERKERLEIMDISNPGNPVQTGFGIMPEPGSFFDKLYNGKHQSYRQIGEYLYWFIGNDPNMPVIEIIRLP